MTLGSLALHGCGSSDPDGPPTIHLGDSVCDQCGMIISDARFATATMIEGDRGPEPKRFDDFSCQIGYETRFPELTIHTRWSHDHGTQEWIATEHAWFVSSPALRTPMASNLAAFATQADAQKAATDLDGLILDFKAAWKPVVDPQP